MPVSAKSKKSWEQLAHTLDEIAPGGQPNPPSEMITSIVEAIYDDYAKANFTNYELRREDLNQLAAFARQFKDVNEFLSQLALISNVDAEAGAESNRRPGSGEPFLGPSSQGPGVSHRLRHLADRRNVSRAHAHWKRAMRLRKSAGFFTWRSRGRAMNFISLIRTCA